MKKVILTLFVGIFTAGAFAQTTTSTNANADNHKEMKDLKKDVRDVRHDRKVRAYELKHHDKAEAKAEAKEIKGDKKEIAGNVRNLKNDGMKHPLMRADKQIHRQNMHHRH
ncbi:MAG: hypothetical protein ABI297_07425 [Ginsengibacter sp.]